MRYTAWMTLVLTGCCLVGITPAEAAAAVNGAASESLFRDVPADHWAATAVQALAARYRVMEGQNDGTFRGARTVTRYELAAVLAKVMARVDESLNSGGLSSRALDSGILPEDLRTIARLQREFRDELEVLTGRCDTLETRVTSLEKRVRVGGETETSWRDFSGSAPQASAPLTEFRVRNRVNLEASGADNLLVRASAFWDLYGPRAQGNAFALNPSGSDELSEFYLQRAYATYSPDGMTLSGGIVNLSEVLTLGSTLPHAFGTNLWREGVGGYGFVGTPGLVRGDAGLSMARLGGAESAATAPVWWLPGTDVVNQALDPNAAQWLYPRGNLTVCAKGDAGPFTFALGWYQPGLTGRDVKRLLGLVAPGNFQGPELYVAGPQMLGSVGADFGWLRAQVAAKSPGHLLDQPGRADKTLSASVDLGSEAFGLNVQSVAKSAFTGQFQLTQTAMTFGSTDLWGTGIGLALAANTGVTVSGVPEVRNLFAGGLAGTDYTSYGLYSRWPGFTGLPWFAVALQQTAGAQFGSTIGSGVTIQTALQLWRLPQLQLEYSLGKFTPGVDNGLMNNASVQSHEQLSAQMVFPF
jgi:hypothetical protein